MGNVGGEGWSALGHLAGLGLIFQVRVPLGRIEDFKTYPGIIVGFYVTVLRVQHVHIRGGVVW